MKPQVGTPYEIVVADDESSVCELLQRGLNEDNFHVTAFTRAEDVVRAVKEKDPCLVILDVHMPDVSGLQVLKEIKATTPDVPVLVISGFSDGDERKEARRLGACDFLAKPFDWKYLRNIAYLSSFLKESKR